MFKEATKILIYTLFFGGAFTLIGLGFRTQNKKGMSEWYVSRGYDKLSKLYEKTYLIMGICVLIIGLIGFLVKSYINIFMGIQSIIILGGVVYTLIAKRKILKKHKKID